MSWKNFSVILGVLLAFQTWRTCTRNEAKPSSTESAECAPSTSREASSRTAARDSSKRANGGGASGTIDEETGEDTSFGPTFNGIKLPTWTLWLAPQPGENMLAYRDRMLPLAQAAVAPHRNRVARGRDDFAKVAGLDSSQKAQLDASVNEAATAIQDKMMGAFLGGELSPATFKPMTGVALARDVLDAVDTANRKFMMTLREDQRAKLAQHPFDFADYMLFSARWEDALGVTN